MLTIYNETPRSPLSSETVKEETFLIKVTMGIAEILNTCAGQFPWEGSNCASIEGRSCQNLHI